MKDETEIKTPGETTTHGETCPCTECRIDRAEQQAKYEELMEDLQKRLSYNMGYIRGMNQVMYYASVIFVLMIVGRSLGVLFHESK